VISTHCCGVFKGYTRLSCNGGSMQECRVCGLLFLGGGACPSCGSQVAVDINTDDIVMDDDAIPGLEEIADAIGDATDGEDKGEVLPFGLGAKAEVIESSLPFGVGSFTSNLAEMTTSSEGDEFEEDIIQEEVVNQDKEELIDEVETSVEDLSELGLDDQPRANENFVAKPVAESSEEAMSKVEKHEDSIPVGIGEDFHKQIEDEIPLSSSAVIGQNNDEEMEVHSSAIQDVPDMWRIDAAEVDMEAIYAQEEQVVEVSFDDEFSTDDVQVTFDDFHHTPVEESMASDEDAPELHPARALPVEASGQPEISAMVDSAFEHMGNSSWMQAAQILSTASNNRQNDPSILNNLGLALLQSALEMDSKNDPMSASQYEAAIMALRQGAKIDAENNTILLNLSHALLVSGRAEKAFRVVNVLRSRESNNVEIENVMGACLIQLGRDDEAESILRPFATDDIVSANLDLI